VALVQAQGSRYCFATFAAVDSVTSNAQVNLVPVYKAGAAEWISGNYIVVPKDGRYVIFAYPDYLRTSNLARRRTAVYLNDVIYSMTELNPLAGTTATGAFSCITTLLDLKAGDKVSISLFQYGTTSSDGISAGGKFCVTLIEDVAPIIAGQGNLVSGGAFQFDAQGNGYTENYLPGTYQVGWRYNDLNQRKPIYRRYFEGTLTIAANTLSTTILLANVEWIRDPLVGRWDNGNGVLMPLNTYSTSGGGVPTATNVFMSRYYIDNVIQNKNLVWNTVSPVARTDAVYQIWVDCTLTTDAWQ
jgi:hypothetical protein